MNKEELEKETAEYFKSICGDYNEEYERTGKRHYWVGFDIKNAYLAGAESREKRIAELEHQLTHRNCLDCSNHSSKLRMRTFELEKENAELKKQLEMSNKVYNDNLDYSHHIEEQLTNAKELLKRYVPYRQITDSKAYKDLAEETEQFLNEVEK